jgi:hypothetical protein
MKKVSVDNRYPSARLKGMQDFMIFVQEPEWKPSKVDVDLMKKLDIAKGRESETAAAIRFLGIVDEDNVPTAEFDKLKLEYQSTLRKLVQSKYTELFNILPLRMINQKRLVSFFGPPVETAEYQAKLFVWLCEQAEIELPSVEKRFHRARFDKKNKKVE